MKKNWIIPNNIILAILFFFATKIFAVTQTHVLLGDDLIFTKKYVSLFLNKRLAILANQASVNSKGKNIIDVLHHARHIHLIEIFSPEHGLRGIKTSKIKDGRDLITKLPVYSLYGPRKFPTKKELKKIDTIVIDLQDVGLRFYTFSTTMALVLKSAKKYHKQVIILDRPNPLGGNIIYGPPLQKKYLGEFTGYYPIPMRHGLTLGELARYFNRFFNIHANLIVIPMHHWQRKLLFNQTHLIWHRTSPALPTFQQAFLYGIFGPLESLPLSAGRSLKNKTAFEIYGAPWISAKQSLELVRKIRHLQLPGLIFHPVSWIPVRDVYNGHLCRGFSVHVTNYQKVKGFYSLLSVLRVLQGLFGGKMKLNDSAVMLGQDWLIQGIKNNLPITALMERSKRQNRQYIRDRKTILLY